MDMKLNPTRDSFLRDAKKLLNEANTLIDEMENFTTKFHFTDESTRKTIELVKNRCASWHTKYIAWLKNATKNCALLTKPENQLIAKMYSMESEIEFPNIDESMLEFLSDTKWSRGKIQAIIKASEPSIIN